MNKLFIVYFLKNICIKSILSSLLQTLLRPIVRVKNDLFDGSDELLITIIILNALGERQAIAKGNCFIGKWKLLQLSLGTNMVKITQNRRDFFFGILRIWALFVTFLRIKDFFSSPLLNLHSAPQFDHFPDAIGKSNS